MAQNASGRITMQVESVDAGVESGLALAASAAWVRLAGQDQNGVERSMYLLFTQVAPSGDSYKNVGKGSIAVDIVAGAIYRKTAAAGTDGWAAFN